MADYRSVFLGPALLLLLLVTLTTEVGAETRCTDSKDCKGPEILEFCSENFGVCEACAPYCTGSEELEANCREHCPLEYAKVYGRIVVTVVPFPAPTSPAEVAPQPGGDQDTNRSDLPPEGGETGKSVADPGTKGTSSKNVKLGFGIGVPLVALVIAIGLIVYFRKFHTGHLKVKGDDPEEGKKNEGPAPPRNEQADPIGLPRSQLVTGHSKEDLSVTGAERFPRDRMDNIDAVQGLKDSPKIGESRRGMKLQSDVAYGAET